jgi:hypothetical protein
MAIGKELDPSVIEAGKDDLTARAILSEHGVSLTEAARYWVTKHSKPLIAAPVEVIRARLLELRTKTQGYHHAKSLRARSRHFEEAFIGRKISTIALPELVLWQDSLELKLEGRTVRNIHDATKQLFKFARKRGYLEADRISAMEHVDRPRANPSKKEIYTPEQMQKLLDAAWSLNSPAAAALAISGFTAIRSEEIYSVDPDKSMEDQLTWEDFRWADGFIYVREEVSKLGIARNVPLPRNLEKMLQPLASKGPIYTETRLDLAYARIARKAALGWKHNALRHSAITYKMLLSNSPAKVANQSGNSIAIIEASYRNRGATKTQALDWFKLTPKTPWTIATKAEVDTKLRGRPVSPKE